MSSQWQWAVSDNEQPVTMSSQWQFAVSDNEQPVAMSSHWQWAASDNEQSVKLSSQWQWAVSENEQPVNISCQWQLAASDSQLSVTASYSIVLTVSTQRCVSLLWMSAVNGNYLSVICCSDMNITRNQLLSSPYTYCPMYTVYTVLCCIKQYNWYIAEVVDTACQYWSSLYFKVISRNSFGEGQISPWSKATVGQQ